MIDDKCPVLIPSPNQTEEGLGFPIPQSQDPRPFVLDVNLGSKQIQTQTRLLAGRSDGTRGGYSVN